MTWLEALRKQIILLSVLLSLARWLSYVSERYSQPHEDDGKLPSQLENPFGQLSSSMGLPVIFTIAAKAMTTTPICIVARVRRRM